MHTALKAIETTNDKSAVRKILEQAQAEARHALSAPEARGVCEACGINIPNEPVARSAEDAGRLAAESGFPVIMKIVSPQILHKIQTGARRGPGTRAMKLGSPLTDY